MHPITNYDYSLSWIMQYLIVVYLQIVENVITL